MERTRYKPLAEYALIGDRRTCALVGTDGSIDSFCFPHFDSPSVFAALVDADRGGYWQIAPHLPDAHHRQVYIPDTNVLLTRALSADGVGEIVDFMPIGRRDEPRALIRRAHAIRGELDFVMECRPRFGYGTALHRATRAADGSVVLAPERGPALRLRADAALEVHDGDVRARFRIGTGAPVTFVLEPAELGDASPWCAPAAVDLAFDDAVAYWRRWVRASTYRGRWQEAVHRSALVLHLLQDADHGAMIAAPTFGLPEWIGGPRNWDYRYVWVRDASFALHALQRLGVVAEADRFVRWLEDLPSEDGLPLRVLYRVDGGTDTAEEILPHLEGYFGSGPVRIGNSADAQLQLDIFGELIDTIYIYHRGHEPLHQDTWRLVHRVAGWVADNWRLADDGIWEMRSGRREFLHSRVMCWVALDRALRLAAASSMPAPIERWRRERDAIYEDVLARFWDPARGAFVQSTDRGGVDASSLLMPLVHFISPTDPMWLSHLRVVEQELVEDATVYRYPPHRRDDGMRGPEGTFTICSFWLVQCLALAGRLDAAELGFAKVLSYANHVGLYGEQLGQRVEHLGNFPQLLTHLGLISAATTLDHALAKAGHPDAARRRQR
jgi:GH15 family glucan-1,4-alpha-glucosidase